MNTEQQGTSATKPLTWTWIVQRTMNDKDDKALAKWEFGFLAPDGAEIRVTLHQTNASDKAEDATYYVTFFCNHSPESFTKWDTSLSHDDSMLVWVTITHGLLDFVAKSSVKILVFDDRANGKLKMILRSVCLDIIDSNPSYEFEQTKQGQFRTFFQVKKKGVPSAFEDQVAGSNAEGETAPPAPQDETAGQEEESDAATGTYGKADAATPTDDVQKPRTDLIIEIGRDYSVTARDEDGHAIDRYQAKGPSDAMRWIQKKGFSGSKLKIVSKAQPPMVDNKDTDKEEPKNNAKPTSKFSECVVADNKITICRNLCANDAALINTVVSAICVRQLEEGIEFEFQTNRDMELKKSLLMQALAEITAPSDTKPGI